MRIIDCFTFFNELDLLELRLRLLDDVVDLFVISEGNYTHSGNPKPFIFQMYRERFKKWEHKIFYIPCNLQVDDTIKFNKVDAYTPEDGSWYLENMQRNALAYSNDKIKPEDVVLLSDLDEIPHPFLLEQFKNNRSTLRSYPVSLVQKFSCFWINYEMRGRDENWKGTVVIPGSDWISSYPQEFRDNRNHYNGIAFGGWHWSYLGGIDKIKTKIESFAHTEFNRDEIKSEENLRKTLDEGKDIYNRDNIRFEKIDIDDVPSYPKKIKELLKQYPQFLKP